MHRGFWQLSACVPSRTLGCGRSAGTFAHELGKVQRYQRPPPMIRLARDLGACARLSRLSRVLEGSHRGEASNGKRSPAPHGGLPPWEAPGRGLAERGTAGSAIGDMLLPHFHPIVYTTGIACPSTSTVVESARAAMVRRNGGGT